jgi:hypothetical protein
MLVTGGLTIDFLVFVHVLKPPVTTKEHVRSPYDGLCKSIEVFAPQTTIQLYVYKGGFHLRPFYIRFITMVIITG